MEQDGAKSPTSPKSILKQVQISHPEHHVKWDEDSIQWQMKERSHTGSSSSSQIHEPKTPYIRWNSETDMVYLTDDRCVPAFQLSEEVNASNTWPGLAPTEDPVEVDQGESSVIATSRALSNECNGKPQPNNVEGVTPSRILRMSPGPPHGILVNEHPRAHHNPHRVLLNPTPSPPTDIPMEELPRAMPRRSTGSLVSPKDSPDASDDETDKERHDRFAKLRAEHYRNMKDALVSGRRALEEDDDAPAPAV